MIVFVEEQLKALIVILHPQRFDRLKVPVCNAWRTPKKGIDVPVEMDEEESRDLAFSIADNTFPTERDISASQTVMDINDEVVVSSKDLVSDVAEICKRCSRRQLDDAGESRVAPYELCVLGFDEVVYLGVWKAFPKNANK
jgi:predicted polyphosphate/ATP-dependent NAD kinase